MQPRKPELMQSFQKLVYPSLSLRPRSNTSSIRVDQDCTRASPVLVQCRWFESPVPELEPAPTLPPTQPTFPPTLPPTLPPCSTSRLPTPPPSPTPPPRP